MEQNCHKCDEADSERMVQCDSCNSWYHFDCVGVDSNVADVSWNCEICRRDTSAAAAKPTASSSPNTYKRTERTQFTSRCPSAIKAPTLDSQARASMLTTTVTTVIPTPLAQSSAIPVTTSFTTSQQFRSATPVTTSQHFLSQNPVSTLTLTPSCSEFTGSAPNTTSQGPLTLTTATQATGIRCPETIAPAITSHFLEPGNAARSSTYIPYINTNSRQPMGVSYANVDKSEMHRNLQLERLKEEMEIQQQYLENKYKILSQYNELPPITPPPFLQNAGPSQSQLIARQAIPKQLPVFSGDPEEWPLFISNFENSTAVAGYTDAENLIRLQASLKGKARDMVKSKLFLPSMVSEIIHTLRMCFGRPEYILERVVNRARAMPPLKDKLEGLVDFALCVRSICNTMEGCRMNTHLHNPLLVQELVNKLPNNHKLSWALHPKDEAIPVVRQFSDWIFCLAEAASTVVNLAPSKSNASVNTHTVEGSAERLHAKAHTPTSKLCCICNDQDHKVSQCEVFKKMSLPRRWDAVKAKNLCRQCLSPHRRKCFVSKVCGIEGCVIKHHPLLHKFVESTVEQVNTHNSGYEESRPLFRIVPIRLYSKNKVMDIYAFLDEGSSVTLIEKNIFDQLGIKGEHGPLCLRWTGNTTRVEENSERASIEISSMTSNQKYTLKNARTVHNLDLPVQSIDIADMQTKYPHLNGLPIKSYDNIKPSLLIGADNWKLAIPLKVKEGAWSEPIASKTRLGWTLQGCESSRKENFRLNVHTCECQLKYDHLHEMVKDFFVLEAPKATEILSEDDAKAVDIKTNTCQQSNGRYEVGLLWRNPNEPLPSSYSNAVRRMKCLEKKFAKDPGMRSTMQQQINNLLDKGYAQKLSLADIAVPRDKVWYLPICVMNNPNKPGKIRMVWDAAAKANGVSLNNFLLSGPDLLNPLVDILLAFRVGRVAICGDIAEMFHRINIRETDMHAQRFLWYDENDRSQHPSVYVMRALTFGLNCAPCIAHFIRDKNADNYKHDFPRAAEAIKRNHYVDDFIDSEDDEHSALELAKQVKEIHRAGGFNIRGWSSNSKSVLDELTDDLGMFWDPASDNFKYICRFARLRRDVINETLAPTKREVLQVLMSIFDPLGFVGCYTIGLKVLLQDVWRAGISWDDTLCDKLYEKWCHWKNMVKLITAVEIPRCYSLFLKEAEEVELHTFVDAGENAYAAVCYLRTKRGEFVSTTLVAAKSKVAPLKPLSIPRLELQAAVVGIRLASTVANVKRIGITSMYWWTDSKTVLRWIRMDPRNLNQYVMYRVGEILEASIVNQWKWVPTKLNPADLATKMSSCANYKQWFTGPEFLALDRKSWPHCTEINPNVEDSKELRHYVLHTERVPMRNVALNVEYFSSWSRLYRAVATFILYVNTLRARISASIPDRTIRFEIVQQAQQFLIKYAQTAFSEEITLLQ
ncbi:PREDICTED: uncharacterized protein LOC108363754 [Rhagoletis zephyria]|uniref:uncharacterized protein LOC108363754 n=1 Tax=Rhagoletis zephyria TaxID=28612 RepID=UPI0008119B99|nr:PREDICTED: uncharacterized protein LOC108363754 [Rhagoletis zephyria]